MDRHKQALEKLAHGTVIPATPLALDAERKFDEKRQRALLRYYMDAGVGGIAVGVHTTQFAIRDPEIALFRPVLELTAQEMARYEQQSGKTLVRVAGACGPVKQAVEEAALAKELGFDAVLLSRAALRRTAKRAACTYARGSGGIAGNWFLFTALGRRTRLYLSVLGAALRDTKRYCNQKCAL